MPVGVGSFDVGRLCSGTVSVWMTLRLSLRCIVTLLCRRLHNGNLELLIAPALCEIPAAGCANVSGPYPCLCERLYDQAAHSIANIAAISH